MLLSNIQKVYTPECHKYLVEHLKKNFGTYSYSFNCHPNFYIVRAITYNASGEGNVLIQMREGKKVVVNFKDIDYDYSRVCEKLFIIYYENYYQQTPDEKLKEQEILSAESTPIPQRDTTVFSKEDEHYYCEKCGMDFGSEMIFRVDQWGRYVCPFCEERKIIVVKGEYED